jgi:hypothetical protein
MLEELTVCEEVFHTAGGVAYADLITDGHRETWPIRSKRFRTWVRRCYYQATGTAAGAAVTGSALDLLRKQRISAAKSDTTGGKFPPGAANFADAKHACGPITRRHAIAKAAYQEMVRAWPLLAEGRDGMKVRRNLGSFAPRSWRRVSARCGPIF